MSKIDAKVRIEKSSPETLNWSKQERFKLLTALKTYKPSNIEAITKQIPNKTSEEVIEAIDWYKSKALNTLKYSADKVYRRLRNSRNKPEIPLTQWSNWLLKSFSLDQLHTATATAARLLVEFEEPPHPEATDHVDFKNVRLMIANALEGRPLPAVNEGTAYIFNKCLIESAVKSKGFIPENVLLSFLRTTNHLRTKTEIESFDPIFNMHTHVHYLALQQSYNPINVPERMLVSHDDMEDCQLVQRT